MIPEQTEVNTPQATSVDALGLSTFRFTLGSFQAAAAACSCAHKILAFHNLARRELDAPRPLGQRSTLLLLWPPSIFKGLATYGQFDTHTLSSGVNTVRASLGLLRVVCSFRPSTIPRT